MEKSFEMIYLCLFFFTGHFNGCVNFLYPLYLGITYFAFLVPPIQMLLMRQMWMPCENTDDDITVYLLLSDLKNTSPMGPNVTVVFQSQTQLFGIQFSLYKSPNHIWNTFDWLIDSPISAEVLCWVVYS